MCSVASPSVAAEIMNTVSIIQLYTTDSKAMTTISIGVTVCGITEAESKALIDELSEEGVIEFGAQDWEIDELGLKFDDYTRIYNLNYVDDTGSSGEIFHAVPNELDEGGLLTIYTAWYHGRNVVPKARDRVAYGGGLEPLIQASQNLSKLAEEIESFTDKDVFAGVIETP